MKNFIIMMVGALILCIILRVIELSSPIFEGIGDIHFLEAAVYMGICYLVQKEPSK